MNNNVNQAFISGMVVSAVEFSHSIYGEDFYQCKIGIERTSGYTDVINAIISERLLDGMDIMGKYVHIEGEIRTRTNPNQIPRVAVFLFAKEISILDSPANKNIVILDGYVCKPPSYRQTPQNREVTDIFLAVNRTCRRSDYVPCIAWDRNAKYTANFGCGKHLRVNGRIQSRDYKKVNENGDVESRTAYEVSISSFDELGGDTVAREEM
jgi:hypothetical protein